MTVSSKKDYMINTVNNNTMKTRIVLLFSILTLTLSSKALAQAPDDCAITLSYFIEPAKAKNYEAALTHYDKVINECPKASLATYQRSEERRVGKECRS